MTILLWGLILPIIAIAVIILGKAYKSFKYPKPRPLGRVLPKLCVVDADEILHYREVLKEEWESKPHLRRKLRRNQIRINSAYFGQMACNTFRFQQVIWFEHLKIDPGKSSFEYEPREVLIENLIDESARLRSEVFSARVDLTKQALLGRAIDQERLQRLLGKYKGLEHDIIELAGMAKDTTCRDMLIERLGLTNWRIVDGGPGVI